MVEALVGRLRARFDERGLRVVNRLSGAIITLFGVLALLARFRGDA